MRSKLYFFLVSFVALSFVATIIPAKVAAEEFTALSVSGKVFFDDGSEMNKIIPGDKIHGKGKIILEENSFANLIDQSKRSIHLSGKAEYDIDDLSDMFSHRTSSLINKIFKLLYDKISSDKGIVDRKRLAQSAGGVRGPSGSEEYFELKRDLASGDVTARWPATKTAGKYTIVVRDLAGEDIFEIETDGNFVEFAKAGFEFDRKGIYEIRVFTGDIKYASDHLYVPSDEEKDEIVDDLAEIDRQFPEDETSRLISKALYFELRSMKFEAMNYYRKLTEAYPDVEEYKELYASYLHRLGRIDQAKAVLGMK